MSGVNSRNQQGLTLVEIMVAMTLGVFITAGILQLFISSRQTYRSQEALSRLQENGRFAIDFMARDIRMAGFRGCASGSSNDNAMNIDLNVATPSNYLYLFRTFIQGFEATSETEWTPAIGADDMNEDAMNTLQNPVKKSDVLTVRRANDRGFAVVSVDNAAKSMVLDSTVSASDATMTSSNANLTASTANLTEVDFVNGKCALAIIANCTTADVFQISTVAGATLNYVASVCASPDNKATGLAGGYIAGAQVYPINTISYYVRNNTAGQPSLYRRVGSSASQELVEGVERMEILYGVDTEPNGTANYFVTADTIDAAGNWGKVVSVRLRLLLATTENNLAAQTAVPFEFNGFDTTADRKLRRIFSDTIALRNRSL